MKIQRRAEDENLLNQERNFFEGWR